MRLYLTNWAVLQAWDRREITQRVLDSMGPLTGRRLCCSRQPGEAQLGHGRVLGVTPPRALQEPAAQARASYDAQFGHPRTLEHDKLLAAAVERYDAELLARWGTPQHLARLAPGTLSYASLAWPREADAAEWDGSWWFRKGPVSDGDTLYCTCPREGLVGGICHRRVAAQVLVRAGWEVILDGAPVEAVSA